MILSYQDWTLPIQWCQDLPWKRHPIYSQWFSGDTNVTLVEFWDSVCYAVFVIHLLRVFCLLISQVFLFVNSKCKHYFHNRLKPSKLCWTAMYRKQHKKVIIQQIYFVYISNKKIIMDFKAPELDFFKSELPLWT